MTLRDEIADLLWNDLNYDLTHRSTSSELTDRIISLLDKQVQGAGWIVPGEYGEAFNVWKDATHEEVISGKAVRR
jgi:hypothetical protein